MSKDFFKILLTTIIDNRKRVTCSKELNENLFWLTGEMISSWKSIEAFIICFFFFAGFFNDWFFSGLFSLPLTLDHVGSIILFLFFFIFSIFISLHFVVLFWVILFGFPLFLNVSCCLILFFLDLYLLFSVPLLLDWGCSLILFLMNFFLFILLFIFPSSLNNTCSFILFLVHSFLTFFPLALNDLSRLSLLLLIQEIWFVS